jgi:hypothetical protein
MITVTIDDPELERVYHTFNGNDKEFTKYLTLTACANNVEYGVDAAMIEASYDEACSDESEEFDHEEVWATLFGKYEKN